MTISKNKRSRSGRKRSTLQSNSDEAIRGGFSSGGFKPLSEADVNKIHDAALHVLETVGMGVIGEFSPGINAILDMGATLSEEGRILYPRSLVEDAIAGTCRSWILHGLDEDRSIEIKPNSVFFGTAGGAVSIRDFDTETYRNPTIHDMYDVTRLIDTLPNIHWCYRPLIARDMESVTDLDINTAYALINGTTKPWGLTFGTAENVDLVVSLFDMVLGGEGRFRKSPVCHSVQGDGVPPLRYAYERCLIKEASIRNGIPLMVASAPQAGATSPAALAGTVVQAVAEVLAGLVYVHAVSPGHPVTFAPWPFVADLRTGSMSGGGGEQGLLSAAAAQMGVFYDLPTSVPAGMADSKVADAQAGFEKGTTTMMAGLAGSSMVHESAGMHGSLLGCSLESFVVDNDMLGNVLRTIRGIEVTDETLSLDVIKEVNINGPGHYLGEQQTLSLMRSEYHYPALADRNTPATWEEEGAKTLRERSRDYVRDTLARHYPRHISSELDEKIRRRFNILLPGESMKPGNGRW